MISGKSELDSAGATVFTFPFNIRTSAPSLLFTNVWQQAPQTLTAGDTKSPLTGTFFEAHRF